MCFLTRRWAAHRLRHLCLQSLTHGCLQSGCLHGGRALLRGKKCAVWRAAVIPSWGCLTTKNSSLGHLGPIEFSRFSERCPRSPASVLLLVTRVTAAHLLRLDSENLFLWISLFFCSLWLCVTATPERLPSETLFYSIACVSPSVYAGSTMLSKE